MPGAAAAWAAGAGLVALAAALAGCAFASALTLEAEGLANGAATRTETWTCGPDAVLSAHVEGTGGSLQVTVRDAQGAALADRVGFSGAYDGELELHGATGPWTVELRQVGFSGGYALRLLC